MLPLNSSSTKTFADIREGSLKRQRKRRFSAFSVISFIERFRNEESDYVSLIFCRLCIDPNMLDFKILAVTNIS